MINKQSTTIPITSNYGMLITAAIIVTRGTICNSPPMEDWSVFSWILMTIPVFFPIYFILTFNTIKYGILGLCKLIERIIR